MRTLALATLLIGCAGNQGSPARAPVPAAPEGATAAAAAPATRAAEIPPAPEVVAVGDTRSDPCDGGEVTSSSGGGIETIGHGTVTRGISHGSGGGGGGPYGGSGGIGGAPPGGAAPRMTPGKAVIRHGKIDPDVVRIMIRRHRNQLLDCYAQALGGDASLAGKVDVHFTIGTDGKVTSATATGFTAQVTECVVARVKLITFPDPDHGEVEIDVPFVFAPR